MTEVDSITNGLILKHDVIEIIMSITHINRSVYVMKLWNPIAPGINIILKFSKPFINHQFV